MAVKLVANLPPRISSTPAKQLPFRGKQQQEQEKSCFSFVPRKSFWNYAYLSFDGEEEKVFPQIYRQYVIFVKGDQVILFPLLSFFTLLSKKTCLLSISNRKTSPAKGAEEAKGKERERDRLGRLERRSHATIIKRSIRAEIGSLVARSSPESAAGIIIEGGGSSSGAPVQRREGRVSSP